MILEIGNVYYYSYMVLSIVIVLVSCSVLRKKSKQFNHLVILLLLFSSFFLHFFKLVFEPYRSGYPYSLIKVSLENLCAVSTVLFPWFYLSKKKVLKDYMVIIGLMSFILALLLPNGLVGISIFNFDVLRYYYAHLVIVLAPLLMVLSGHHKLTYKRILKVPFVFYLILVLILFNEIVLIAIGLIEQDFNALFNADIRNIALVWGLPKQLASIEWMVPKLFRTIPFGVNAGMRLYWSVIWVVVPSYVVICLFGFLEIFILKLIKKHH